MQRACPKLDLQSKGEAVQLRQKEATLSVCQGSEASDDIITGRGRLP